MDRHVARTASEALASSLGLTLGSLADVLLPEGLVSIGDSAFASCSSLSSIVIPDSVSGLGTLNSRRARGYGSNPFVK